MNRSETLSRLAEARTGHLATITPDGRPHVVVVTFALVDELVVTAIDQKPKRTRDLQRLRNIDANPAVSFLADRYDEDWRALWWVRVDGIAEVDTTGERHDRVIEALIAKYRQYREAPPDGPVIVITTDVISGWASTP
jgi:PPOX class probable F420-dependent enzyme